MLIQPPSVHTTALTLGWAVYQPFNTDHTPAVEDESWQAAKPVSLELKSGPGFTPMIIPYSAHNACYKVRVAWCVSLWLNSDRFVRINTYVYVFVHLQYT